MELHRTDLPRTSLHRTDLHRTDLHRAAGADGSRVRLMQMTTQFAIGGTERQLVDLANGLDPDRFEVGLACLGRSGSLLGQLRTSRPPEEFPIRHLYGLRTMREQARFAFHLWQEGVQVFHAQGFYPNVFGIPAARMARTPVVLASVRDLGDHRTRMQNLAQRMACGLADAVVVNAQAVKRQLVAEGVAAEKIHVIHNGVDLARFEEARRSPELLASLGLPLTGPLVMVVSRLGPAKGIEQFIDAAAPVAQRFPKAHFLIVGDAAADEEGRRYRAALEKRARLLDLGKRLVFSGSRLDVPQLLALATVAVLPSHSEALSNALLESMASGAPVVATDVGGNPEVVEDGITGCLVPAQSPVPLAQAICRLLEWPQEAARLGAAGQRLVHERFSVGRMVRDTAHLYTNLLARSQRGTPFRRGNNHGTPIATHPPAP